MLTWMCRPTPVIGVKRTWRGLVSMSANDPKRTSIALEEGVRNYWVASVSLRVTSAIEASCQGSSTLLNAPVPNAPAYAPVPDKTLYSPVKPLPFHPPV